MSGILVQANITLPGLAWQSLPNPAKVLRLAFHDCMPYVDSSNGRPCDGCLDWVGAGTRFDEAQTTRFIYEEELDETDGHNNGLYGTAAVLEQIYTDAGYPSGPPALNLSLADAGASRADLWAFAALVAGVDGTFWSALLMFGHAEPRFTHDARMAPLLPLSQQARPPPGYSSLLRFRGRTPHSPSTGRRLLRGAQQRGVRQAQ